MPRRTRYHTVDERQAAHRERTRASRLQESEEHVERRRMLDAARHSSARRTTDALTAKDFNETPEFQQHRLPATTLCPLCSAIKFKDEPPTMCCSKGRVNVPVAAAPPELLDLYNRQDDVGKEFRTHIRAYNSLVAFTSMGVKVDENLANAKEGVYTFRAQGQIYHAIGGLLPDDGPPRFLQLYIYDTHNEDDHRMRVFPHLHRPTVARLRQMLDRVNPFVGVLRQISELPDIQRGRLLIQKHPSHDRRVYNLPTVDQIAAVWAEGDNPQDLQRHIIVYPRAGNLQRVSEIAAPYDPLQYPLLFPCGETGWYAGMPPVEGNRKVSARQYYANRLHSRPTARTVLHLAGRLFHQYVVDNYVKIEAERLSYIRGNQDIIRSELYRGLQDVLAAGETRADRIGRRVVLPSSFMGGPRDMHQRFQDAMALVQRCGKPDLFITMTCNPDWPEIHDQLLPGQKAMDRPDLTTRIFRAKLHELKSDLFKNRVFGRTVANIYVIEFQKRGLPHTHILIILHPDDKPRTPDYYDKIVRAELPDPNTEPKLHSAVIKHMIHGPCGAFNKNYPCMVDGKCNKRYPREFCHATQQGNDSYPTYRRRDNGCHACVRGVAIDNRWVVPYNAYLLLKYDCHINVEICASIKSVKYLYKYVYKGHDRATLEVSSGDGDATLDEIKHFVDARWVSASEACWRIFEFDMAAINPSVYRLQLHLPDAHSVRFSANADLQAVATNPINAKTMLTEFFAMNTQDNEAKQYLYREFPEHYVWNAQAKVWRKRKSKDVIGRMYSAHPNESERYYLRLLLNHVRGAASFEDLMGGCATFRESAQCRGLLESDNSAHQCMTEAGHYRMPAALRQLFVTLLLFADVSDPRKLFDDNYDAMSEDFARQGIPNGPLRINTVLQDINHLLEPNDKTTKDFNLPVVDAPFGNNADGNRLIAEELSIPVSDQDVANIRRLTQEQRAAFEDIMERVASRSPGAFFLDGPAGTGKTFVYRTIMAAVRSQNRIAIATASSGISAILMPGGRTAHSRFKIPVPADSSSMCNIRKQTNLARLISAADVLIWDEAPMTHRHAIEALDRTLRDIMETDSPFGGKVVVFGGDFRQVLPVIAKGTRAQIVDASLSKSALWQHIQVYRLRANMRADPDAVGFRDFLLHIGDDTYPTISDDLVRIPDEMIVEPPEGDRDSPNKLIEEIYPDLEVNAANPEFFTSRAILASKHEYVDTINDAVLRKCPGNTHTYHSFDSVEDDVHNLYPQEFLNSIAPGGLPPHELNLKVGVPVMCIRNLNPSEGLCNGTRLLCQTFHRNVIEAEIITGDHCGKRVFLPRLPLMPSDDVKLPFKLKRKQFPIVPAFALTINKSQGQTIPNVGIYLPEPVFSHGQLYVALSRGKSFATTKLMIRHGHVPGREGIYTKNVVYKDALLAT